VAICGTTEVVPFQSPSGLKPIALLRRPSARLKSCPDTKPGATAGPFGSAEVRFAQDDSLLFVAQDDFPNSWLGMMDPGEICGIPGLKGETWGTRLRDVKARAEANAGPSTPLKNASLRMTAMLFVARDDCRIVERCA
jgi:hypothetical protein